MLRAEDRVYDTTYQGISVMAVSIFSAKLPILAQLLDYRREWLKLDFAAGLSVAAVSLPSAIAYPAIAGLPTEIGFFATILALVAYAIFGPSRQLIVGPDAATCIMLASVLEHFPIRLRRIQRRRDNFGIHRVRSV